MPYDLRENTDSKDGSKLWDFVFTKSPGEAVDKRVPKLLAPAEFEKLMADNGGDQGLAIQNWPTK